MAGLYEFHAGICSCPDSGFTNFMQDIHWAVKKVLVFRESGFWGPVLRKTRTSPPPKSLLTITGRDREKIGVGAGFARTRLYSLGEASEIRQRPGNVGQWPTLAHVPRGVVSNYGFSCGHRSALATFRGCGGYFTYFGVRGDSLWIKTWAAAFWRGRVHFGVCAAIHCGIWLGRRRFGGGAVIQSNLPPHA